MTIRQRLEVRENVQRLNDQHLLDFYRDQYEQAKRNYLANPNRANLLRYLEANDRYFTALNR